MMKIVKNTRSMNLLFSMNIIIGTDVPENYLICTSSSTFEGYINKYLPFLRKVGKKNQ